MKWIFVIILVFLVMLMMMIKNKQKTSGNQEKIEENVDYSNAYQKRYLLNKTEWCEYQKLKKYAAEKQLLICPKVRLLDLVEPQSGDGYMAKLGKIQSKDVDFVLTDQDLRVKAILELDNSKQNSEKQKQRDQFVDQVLTNVGYKVIRTKEITEETLKDL